MDMNETDTAAVAALIGFVATVAGGFLVVSTVRFFESFAVKLILALTGILLVGIGTTFAIDVARSLGWLP
jgi:hypothetical protein